MSLGTSILIASIIVSVVALFIATKDRWNWKKIAWRFLGLPLLLLAIAAGGWYAYSLIPTQPKPQVVFWDIPLRATKSDVKFLKGAPTKTLDNDRWVYEKTKTSSGEDDFDYAVGFREGKVRYILCFRSDACTSLEGVGHGASYNTVVDTFGSPSSVSNSEDDLIRLLSFDRFNVVFVLAKNQVDVYGIYDPKFGPLEFIKETR